MTVFYAIKLSHWGTRWRRNPDYREWYMKKTTISCAMQCMKTAKRIARKFNGNLVIRPMKSVHSYSALTQKWMLRHLSTTASEAVCVLCERASERARVGSYVVELKMLYEFRWNVVLRIYAERYHTNIWFVTVEFNTSVRFTFWQKLLLSFVRMECSVILREFIVAHYTKMS
jgi:hypothetical protein